MAFWGLGVGGLVGRRCAILFALFRAASLTVGRLYRLPRPMSAMTVQSRVSKSTTEPGELPQTMTAWVIREER